MALSASLCEESEYDDFGADSHDHFLANCFIDSIYLTCLFDSLKLCCLHRELEEVKPFIVHINSI